MHGEIKGGRGKKRNRECGVGGWGGGGGDGGGEGETECDTGVHFSSTASHPVRVCVTAEGLKNLGFAPQQRQGEECSWGD